LVWARYGLGGGPGQTTPKVPETGLPDPLSGPPPARPVSGPVFGPGASFRTFCKNPCPDPHFRLNIQSGDEKLSKNTKTAVGTENCLRDPSQTPYPDPLPSDRFQASFRSRSQFAVRTPISALIILWETKNRSVSENCPKVWQLTHPDFDASDY
jgi:hypothetical protein